jgi:hypothetical protein
LLLWQAGAFACLRTAGLLASVLQTDTARVATQVSTKLLNDLPVQVNGDVRSPFDPPSPVPFNWYSGVERKRGLLRSCGFSRLETRHPERDRM